MRSPRLVFAAACLLGLVPLAAPAWADPLLVENGTDRPLCQLRLTEAAVWAWSEDHFAECLPPGRFREVPLPDNPGRMDVLAVFEDGRTRTYYGLDLSRYRYLLLWEDEAHAFSRPPLFNERPGQTLTDESDGSTFR